MPTEQTDTTQTPPEEITYTPTVWADGEDGGTPINAANMNNIEEAIVALVERTTKQVVTSMIADGAVTKEKLEKTLGDSLSQASGTFDNARWCRFGPVVVVCGNYITTAAETVQLGTIPAPHRPSVYVAVPVTSTHGSYVEVSVSGGVKLVAKGGGNNYFAVAYAVG